MKLQLYFYNHEKELLPKTVFEIIDSDITLERLITKLTGITYFSGNKNQRESGTKLNVIYSNKEYPIEITRYVKNRRVEFIIFLKDALIKTMINIVPVESHSEIVISSVVETYSYISYLTYLMRKPWVTTEYNTIMKHL